MRQVKHIVLENPEVFKTQLLHWSSQSREVVFLDSNQEQNHLNKAYSSYDVLVAVDAFTSIKTDSFQAFKELDAYQKNTKDWLFGYLSYDLKNDIEPLQSDNFDGLNFPELYFFQPQKLFLIHGNSLEMHYLNFIAEEMDIDLKTIYNQDVKREVVSSKITIQERIGKEKYLEKIHQMLTHIYRGDIYEANLCMEFFSEGATIDPADTYLKLNTLSQPPFAVYMRLDNHYLLSASPERYLKKMGNKIISQPIKGTAKRVSNFIEDQQLAIELQNSAKERSENIMITDLVRNDLSKTALKGTVNVEELCGLYSFKQVHQLISTIVSQVSENTSPVEVIKTTFPMGSMTGAPKISAMKIIETLEETKRGLYSGAIGYFTPDSDFDFSVVIRSILYNSSDSYLSFSVGSAITANSNPDAEYEECLLKANAMLKSLV